MKTEQLVKPVMSNSYYGRVVSEISHTPITKKDISDLGMKLLNQKPAMLRASLNSRLIKNVWQSTCYGRGKEYYIIETTDGTMFHIQ
jgi:hypothetical protein